MQRGEVVLEFVVRAHRKVAKPNKLVVAIAAAGG